MTIAANEIAAARKAKTYTIIKTRRGIQRETTDTLEELIKGHSYTLEKGNSYNPKINRNPKTIKALISALNKSISETQRNSTDPDYYEQG